MRLAPQMRTTAVARSKSTAVAEAVDSGLMKKAELRKLLLRRDLTPPKKLFICRMAVGLAATYNSSRLSRHSLMHILY